MQQEVNVDTNQIHRTIYVIRNMSRCSTKFNKYGMNRVYSRATNGVQILNINSETNSIGAERMYLWLELNKLINFNLHHDDYKPLRRHR